MKHALALALALVAAPALAAETPHAGPGDPHIRIAPYDPDQVVRLTGRLGFAMTLEFNGDERIENVSIGDALGWQITPNKRADLLFLKPVDRASPTNMTVITDRRRYQFELSVAPAKSARDDLAYVVRFRYPPPPPPPPSAPAAVEAPEPATPPESWNFAYAYDGDRALLPTKLFDDGQATFFQWPTSIALPTVFAVNADGSERLVNTAVRGGYSVADEVAAKFRIRQGKAKLTVVNEGFHRPSAGPQSPQRLRGNALKDLLAREHRW